jgi:hypothetical protein
LKGRSFRRVSKLSDAESLKGHGFSRAARATEENAALAAEGMPVVKK